MKFCMENLPLVYIVITRKIMIRNNLSMKHINLPGFDFTETKVHQKISTHEGAIKKRKPAIFVEHPVCNGMGVDVGMDKL